MKMLRLLGILGLLIGTTANLYAVPADHSEEMLTDPTPLPGGPAMGEGPRATDRWGEFQNYAIDPGQSGGGLAYSLQTLASYAGATGVWYQPKNYAEGSDSDPARYNGMLPGDQSGNPGMSWLKDSNGVSMIDKFGRSYTWEMRFRIENYDFNDLVTRLNNLGASGEFDVLDAHAWAYPGSTGGATRSRVKLGVPTNFNPADPHNVELFTHGTQNDYLLLTASQTGSGGGPPVYTDGQWHTLRVVASHHEALDVYNETGNGVNSPVSYGRTRFIFNPGTPNEIEYSRNRFDHQNWGQTPYVDVPNSRFFEMQLTKAILGAGGPNEANMRGDIYLDYVRMTHSVLPNNVPLEAAGPGAGSFTLSGTTVVYVGGSTDPDLDYDNQPGAFGENFQTSLKPSTDFDRIQGTGTVTLGGTLAVIPMTPQNSNRQLNRTYNLPDIGQGGNRGEFDGSEYPVLPANNPTLHRGKKISREIVKGAAVNGSFSGITYRVFDPNVGEAGEDVDQPGTAQNGVGIFKKVTISGGNTANFVILNAKLGDADGDEIVSATDVFTTLSNLGAATVGGDWTRGNFDLDNVVSASDVFTALSNLGSYSATVVSGSVSTVPEPASGLLLLSILAIGGVARRRV